MTWDEERSRWKVHADRVVDQNPHLRLSIASVELPDGTRFDQYVARMPRCAMTVVLDDDAERILLIWRHRFVIDRWVWELPGGYIDPGEDGLAAAAREVEEETGYRPRAVEHILTFQPMAGSTDCGHELYLARGADQVSAPDPNETEAIRWMPLGGISGLIAFPGIEHLTRVERAAHCGLQRERARVEFPAHTVPFQDPDTVLTGHGAAQRDRRVKELLERRLRRHAGGGVARRGDDQRMQVPVAGQVR